MTDREIVDKVQKWIISGVGSFDIDFIRSDNNKNASVALRMMNSYLLYKKDEKFKTDFECSLRNYLLTFVTDIMIPEFVPNDNNFFGLIANEQTGQICVNYALPAYVNDSFVNTVFNSPEEKPYDDKHIKLVNHFIYSLTNHKFYAFKSVEQQLAVMGALRVPEGYTALVAMSTGSGKSLITYSVAYQMPESLTVVIVPTISLMLDQYRSAVSLISPGNPNEIKYYYSDCDADVLIDAIERKEMRILFISPETIIRNHKLRNSLINANQSGYLRNLIIDEAHIVIEWGSSFRMDFQCIDAFRKRLIKDNMRLRTYLLSATFSKRTVEDLKMFYSDDGKWIEIRLDSLRKEQRYDIIKCNSYTEKHRRLMKLVCKLPHPMVIYVHTPDDAETIQSQLSEIGFNNTRRFTGKTGSAERKRIINEWINDEFDLMIATCAFGVGVDKRDVRTVLHTYVPSGPDQYYQECGRGGRDGRPCLSVMLYTNDDITAARSLMQKVLTVEKLSGRWFSMINSDKTVKHLDEVVIDTSVKPDYNDDALFYTEANNADITWNVYVVLLLRRSGILSIENVEYDDGKYFFKVKIFDNNVFFKNEASDKIFNKIREEEYRRISVGIEEIIGMIRKTGKSCWSTMFNDVYNLTDEYCAGCNAHSEIHKEKNHSFPLKKPVESYSMKMENKIAELMHGSDDMLVICEGNPKNLILGFVKVGVDMIVIPDSMKLDSEILDSDNTRQMIIDFNEFFELCRKNNSLYLAGSIVFYIGDDNKLAAKVLGTAAKKSFSKIYIVNSNLYVYGWNKNISELVSGSCVFDHTIAKEFK